MLGPEVLELGRVSARLCREINQLHGAIETTVVIRRDVCDEIGRVVVADFSAGNLNRWQGLGR
jgi:phage host-nuclease inhibitor protein Gam